jgi:FKBP-type peptidyl-prolyl cis-trans isomerase FkpA
MMNDLISIQKILVLALMILTCSCTGSQNPEKQRIKSQDISLETYINVNRQLVEREQEKIESYVHENDLALQKTGSGLWYGISEQGSGNKIKKGNIVTLKYQIRLMNGTICYDSDDLGLKEFLVGQGGVESGLEEGVLLLKKGSAATFIMPPHLAHGLIGDDDQIPARASIIYDVEVMDVKSP